MAAAATSSSPKGRNPAKAASLPPANAEEDEEARAFREAVLAQAAHLGLDPDADAEFLW